MEDGYRLIDYGVNLNDVIQLMVRAAPLPTIEQSENDEALSEESNKMSVRQAADCRAEGHGERTVCFLW